ncbi:hypothetical protein P8452_23782 [Trifolium repens]|nr:hypothetical protein P8452_23779 [Trifolium repens]WJX35842.1 hypothetical protein P8452_23782 [Trifolium repens]
MSNCLSESDYDDVPVRATKLLSSLNLGKCSISNSDGSVKKRLSTLPIKRPLDNSDSFHTSVKKPKVYARRLVGRPYSTRMKENIKIELEMVENLIRNCKRTRNAEDEKLQSIERDVEECSKKIRKMKRKATRLRTISQYYNNMQNRIEECVQDLTEKEAQVCLIEDLIKRHNHELEKNKIELCKVEDNNNKDGGRKRSSRVFRKQIDECTKEIKTKEEELDALKIFVRDKIDELQTDRKKLLNVMDKRDKRRADRNEQLKDFESTKKQCDRRLKELHSKEKHFEVQAKELESKQEEFEGRLKEFESKEEKFKSQLKELEIKKKRFESEVNELESKKKLFEKRVNEHESEKKHCENQTKELYSKEKQFKGKMKELVSNEKHLEGRVNEFELKEREFEGQVKELESKKKHFENRVMLELESKENHLEGLAKEFRSKEEKFQGQVKELESKSKNLERQVNELNSREKQLEGWMMGRKKYFETQVKELGSKEQQLEARVKAFEIKEHEFKGQLKELESDKMHFESQLKELKLKEDQLESRVKEFESKEVKFNDQVKELDTKMNDFESRVKELNTNQKHFEIRVKDLESKLKQYQGRVEEFQSKEEEFKGRVTEFKSKEKDFESQIREFQSKEEEFKGRVREFELKWLELQLNELKSKENQFEGQVKDLELMQNEFDGQLKELELRDNQCETLIKSFEEEIESDDQLSPTIDGRSLQLLPIEQTVKHELHGNEILTSLLASSDPSKVVLDIIQNPIIPQCRKGDNVVIIDDGHIVILEQLMRISPQIKPCVREEATRLVLNLKAYIGENTENSVAVLGFLLLLSIYGLVPYFDEDEVLKLFGVVAQHKIAVELFGTMGLADKVYDFVQNLIGKKQHIEAVRFICAYNMANKNQSVDLLREHVQSAKVISEINCKKTNSIKIKDNSRDQEIDTLRTVLQCISDNNIESVDLLNQIQGRILELSRQKRHFDV